MGTLRLTLPLHDAKISVLAYNKNGPSEPASVEVRWRGPGREEKPTLYVLAIGVTRYSADCFCPKFTFPPRTPAIS